MSVGAKRPSWAFYPVLLGVLPQAWGKTPISQKILFC